MRKTILLAALPAALLWQGCRPSIKVIISSVNKDLKAAFYYQGGTYWVYKDSLTGRVDSFYVSASRDASILQPTANISPQEYVESIFINVRECNTSPTFPADTQMWNMSYTSNVMRIQYYNFVYQDRIAYYPFINYPFQSTLTSDTLGVASPNPDTGVVVGQPGQYTVAGQTFQNVAEVYHYMNAPSYAHNDTFFICPDAGIIKMYLNHPLDSLNRRHVWELQRWHIVK